MESERKTRGDSVIDTRLSGAEQDAFFLFCEGGPDGAHHTLEQAQTYLFDAKGIELSRQAISNWLGKRRKEAADFQFAAILSEIRQDSQRAEAFGEQLGQLQIDGLTQANVAMLSQALFRAQREKNPASMEFFTNLLSALLTSVAKQRAGTASVISAETARDRFQFDAAKRALEAAAALQKINEGAGDQREKVDRARAALFGQRPGSLLTSPEAGAESDVSNGRLAGSASNIGDVSNSGDRVEL